MRKALFGLTMLAGLAALPAVAQQPVKLVYQVCSSATGVQVCSWVPAPTDANGNPNMSIAGCSSPSCAYQTDTSVPININTATTTQLVAPVTGKKIYVTSANVVAGGTGNITFTYGTGASCTGANPVTGPYPLTAQSGLSTGSGLGPVWVVPASNGLCAVTSAAVQMSGSISFTQQ